MEMSEQEKVSTKAESSEEEGQIIDEDDDDGIPPDSVLKKDK